MVFATLLGPKNHLEYVGVDGGDGILTLHQGLWWAGGRGHNEQEPIPALGEPTVERPHLTASVRENAPPEGVIGSPILQSVVPNDSISIPWKLVIITESLPLSPTL